jgi:hypothetical protein
VNSNLNVTRPGPAGKPHDFQAPTNHAAVVNEIVAFIVRLNLLKLHRLIAIDASHEIEQRATIVIHMCFPAKQWFGLKLPPALAISGSASVSCFQ